MKTPGDQPRPTISESLSKAKDHAIAAGDYETAANLRDLHEMLRHLNRRVLCGDSQPTQAGGEEER